MDVWKYLETVPVVLVHFIVGPLFNSTHLILSLQSNEYMVLNSPVFHNLRQ